jgi:glycosyltransferase involved in cell wall biosynthesis
MLSILAIAHNHQDYTGLFLASLANPACADAEFELIFISNGSTDQTETLVKNYPLKQNPFFKGLVFDAFPENRGVAAAINQAAALSHGNWILQADNDVVFGPGSLSLLNAWRSKFPNALISPNWPWIQKKLGEKYFTAVAAITPKKLERLHQVGLKAPLEMKRATGSCWLCPKTLFNQVGGWDAQYLNACASDDFIWKMALSGAACLTVPCPVFHAGKITRACVPKSQEQEQKDLARFRAHWGGHPENKRLLEQQLQEKAVTQGGNARLGSDVKLKLRQADPSAV